MTPLPLISELRRAGETLTLALDVTSELAPVEGHFPGTPILPAVAQVDWAIRIARANFALPARFSALRALKFLRVVQPPVKLMLELARLDDGHTVTFAFSHAGAACATGRIEFADDAARPDRSLL